MLNNSSFYLQEERVGYFPAKSVSLLSNVKETRSLGSLSSSSDSSINSTASGMPLINLLREKFRIKGVLLRNGKHIYQRHCFTFEIRMKSLCDVAFQNATKSPF